MNIRPAAAADLPAIVAMLADDPLGAVRERPGDPAYARALNAIERQEGNTLLVAEQAGVIIGCLQLTLIPGLSHTGATRAQIETVRVAGGRRGAGLGARLFEDAIERARAAGCTMVQLTTDRSRDEALRFYERLGFKPTHWGMKLSLRETGEG